MTPVTDARHAQRLRDLLPVIAAAADPHERAAAVWCRPVPTPEDRRARRRARWVQAAAGGDHRAFSRLLDRRGLHSGVVDRMLGDVAVRDDVAIPADLPDWARSLVELFAAADGASGDDPLRARDRAGGMAATPADADPPWPFHDAHAPFLGAATDVARNAIADTSLEVDDEVATDLVASCARRLARVTTPCLSRPPGGSVGSSLSGLVDLTLHELYLTDPQDLLAGWLDVFRLAPVLARVLGVTWSQWWTTTRELLSRLDADLDELHDRLDLGDRGPLGPLVRLEADLGDPHSGGRAVARLTFANGCRIMAKPRPLRVVEGYHDLLEAMQDHDLPVRLTPRPILARAEHGWELALEPVDVTDRGGFHRYYVRYGAMARLLHALGGHDLTSDNILAVGEEPVPVDLETLLRPRPRPQGHDPAGDGGAYAAWLASPAPTGLFTCWITGAIGAPATSASPLTPGPATAHSTTPAGTTTGGAAVVDPQDNAAIPGDGWRPAPVDTSPAIPRLAGRPADPRDFHDDVQDGHRRMGTWLDRHADWLTAPDGPIAAMAQHRVRFVHRSSTVYDRLLQASLQPDGLVDGWRRETILERLWTTLEADPHAGPLVDDEIASLRQLDVPLFHARGNGTAVARHHGPPLPDHLEPTAHARVVTTLSSRDRRDPDDSAVGALLHCLDPRPIRSSTTRPDVRSRPASREPGRLLAAATDIAHVIRDVAHRAPDGGIGWLGVTTEPWWGSPSLRPLGPDLLDGTAGLAVVLAELAAATRDPVLVGFAQDVVAHLADQVTAMVPTIRRASAPGGGRAPVLVGGLVGPGAALYGLARAATTIGLDDARGIAVEAAGQLALPVVEASRDDLVTGRAGLVANLVAVAATTRRRRTPLLARAHDVAAGIDVDLPRPTPVVDPMARMALPVGPAGVRYGLAALSGTGGTTRPAGDPDRSLHTQGRSPTARSTRSDVTELPVARGAVLAEVALAATTGVAPPWVDRALDRLVDVDPADLPTRDVLGWLAVATTVVERTLDPVPWARRPELVADLSGCATKLTHTLLDRATSGSWFPDLRVADQHNLSAVQGIGAMALAFVRLASPDRGRSLVLLD